ARSSEADFTLVYTRAYTSGVYAEILKYRKLQLVRPDAVVAFQRGEELEPILSTAARFFSIPVTGLKVAAGVRERFVEERSAHREARLQSYFLPPLSRWRVK